MVPLLQQHQSIANHNLDCEASKKNASVNKQNRIGDRITTIPNANAFLRDSFGASSLPTNQNIYPPFFLVYPLCQYANPKPHSSLHNSRRRT